MRHLVQSLDRQLAYETEYVWVSRSEQTSGARMVVWFPSDQWDAQSVSRWADQKAMTTVDMMGQQLEWRPVDVTVDW